MKYKINWEEKLPEIISTWDCNNGTAVPSDGSKSPYNLTHPGFTHNFAETDILEDSDIIFKWPPESLEIDPGSITHPNSDVLVERGKKVCSAFFGESFTFGDSLATEIKSVGEKRFRYDNFTYRMNNNLGGHFTRIMDTDYLLKAVPGQSNVCILIGLENSIKHLSETYDKVYIVVQLTETGRDWKHENVDSEELMGLRGNSFYDYFVKYENWYSDKLNKLQEQYPNCEFIVWRNFTRWLGGDFRNVKTVDKVMIEYFYELTLKYGSDKVVNLVKNKYGDSLPVSVGGNPHWEELSKGGLARFFHRDTEGVQCILDECDKWETAMDWMKDSNNIFEGRGAYHPTSIGHRVFVEYIIKSLNL